MGGLVGAALWFGHRTLVVASLLATLAVYAALGVSEVVPALDDLHLGVHLLITVIALLALRIGLQYCLLREEHETGDSARYLLCPHCEYVAGDMVFCPNCGVAAAASSPVRYTGNGWL